MATDANPPLPPRSAAQRRADNERLAEISAVLLRTVDATVAPWIERSVVERLRAWSGHVSPELAAEAVAAGERARAEVVPALRTLLDTDVDEQRTNPLALLRGATRHAHEVLERAGMPAMPRDQFAERSFPSDVYGLVPAAWADIAPELHEAGIAWGAAKAFVFKARRRDEGMT